MTTRMVKSIQHAATFSFRDSHAAWTLIQAEEVAKVEKTVWRLWYTIFAVHMLICSFILAALTTKYCLLEICICLFKSLHLNQSFAPSPRSRHSPRPTCYECVLHKVKGKLLTRNVSKEAISHYATRTRPKSRTSRPTIHLIDTPFQYWFFFAKNWLSIAYDALPLHFHFFTVVFHKYSPGTHTQTHTHIRNLIIPHVALAVAAQHLGQP